MFERPFGQTNEQAKKAEEIFSGHGLSLEKEEDKGQFYTTKSKETEIKNIDEACGLTEEELIVADEKLENSVLKNAKLEDMN